MPELPKPDELETLPWERSHGSIRIDKYATTIEYKRHALDNLDWLKTNLPDDCPRNPFVVGIDPGRNFGIACLGDKSIRVYTGEMPKQKVQANYGILAYHLIRSLFLGREPNQVGIEGSSYESFGEANLAYIRSGFIYGFESLDTPSHLLSPKTARKLVLGNGDRFMSEYIHDMADHGADALCIAFSLLHYTLPKENKNASLSA